MDKQFSECKPSHFVMINTEDSNRLRGVLKKQEPMSKHTSWRVGGTANSFYIPADLDDLSIFLAMQPENESITWVGLGSNLLVRDLGIRGTVVSVTGILDELLLKNNGIFKVGAGVTCAKTARFTADAGYKGAEFLAGIPGTFGGALAMNAGAFGGEIWGIVHTAETINRKGKRVVRSRDEFDIDYRTVSLSENEWFVAAEIELKVGNKKESHKHIRELLSERAKNQPIGKFSCGSVFRNPEGNYAARLIEDCGLKGLRMGNACVSEKHANFIINCGGSCADEIEKLIFHVQQVVKEKTGVELKPEVQIIGEKY